jgi:hypothetical protein
MIFLSPLSFGLGNIVFVQINFFTDTLNQPMHITPGTSLIVTVAHAPPQSARFKRRVSPLVVAYYYFS